MVKFTQPVASFADRGLDRTEISRVKSRICQLSGPAIKKKLLE
jgi:hypothetical protein